MAGDDTTTVGDQPAALPIASLLSKDPGAVLPSIANGFTCSPMFLSQPTAMNPTAAATDPAPAGPPADPPNPNRISPTDPNATDPRKIHSQPTTLEDSVRALTDLRIFESSANGGVPTPSAAAAAAAAIASLQDPRLAASQAHLTQQLHAANALNQHLQATAITQQMQVDSLSRQLNQQLATGGSAAAALAAAAPASVAAQYQQFHQYPPAAYASAPTAAAQQQQQQLQALSQQLQLNAYLHQQQQQAAAAAAAQQGLTSSPQLAAALQGAGLMSLASTNSAAITSPRQQSSASAAGQASAQPQPTATVVTTGAGRQQVLLTPAGMAAALSSAAATAPGALQLLHQTSPLVAAASGQAGGVLGTGSLTASATSASVVSERSTKIKLLLSSGGQFDKSTSMGTWEYHGGETRLVTVAHTPQFQQLLLELSKGTTTMLHDERVQLKYELPGSPDVLVDLINDDDVDNMWDEWQSFTLTAKPTYKLHIFVQLLETPPGSSATTTPSSSAAQRSSGGSSRSGGSGAATPRANGGGALVEAGRGTITTQPRVDLLDLEGKLELIPPSDLTIVKFLGSGGYGEVYLSRWHSSDVAVKCLNPSLFSANEGLGSVSEEVVGELVKEANMLGSLRHPNVVWVYGLVLPTGSAMQRLKGQLEPGQSIDAVGFAATAANQAGLAPGVVRPPALVTEYLAGGSLRNAIVRKEEWLQSRSVKIKLMLDTARGMEYLHAKRIVHFDLKSGNLLIGFQNRAPVCKVADFGLSKQRQQTYVTGVTSMRGTLPWTAPEIIRTPKAVNEKVDVYSFGICMWEVWTAREPFEGINYHALLHMMTQQNGLRPPLPGSPEWELGELEEPAEGWVDLMTRCWSDLPCDRPAFVEVVRELQAMLAAARTSRRAASA